MSSWPPGYTVLGPPSWADSLGFVGMVDAIAPDGLEVRLGRTRPVWSEPIRATLECAVARLSALEVPGLIAPQRVLWDDEDQATIVLPRSMGSPASSLDLGAWLRLAVGALRALAGLHGAGLHHGALCPRSLRGSPGGGVELTGVRLPSDRCHDRIRATLGSEAYLAPEAMDPMRAVDHRADLYALGATLRECVADAPPPVAAVLARLVAPEPSARYQSAVGALADFVTLQRQWVRTQRVRTFEPGALDVALAPLPRVLFGEKDTLAALARAAAGIEHGGSAVVAVTGPPGSGVSSILRAFAATRPPHELRGRATASPGHELMPLHGVAAVLSDPVKQQVAIPGWRARIAAMAAPHVLRQIAPSIAVEGLAPSEPVGGDEPERLDQIRTALKRVIDAFATVEHPLVLVLDDAQWLDDASVDFLAGVAASSHRERALLVVLGGHDGAWSRHLERLGKPAIRCALEPLSPEATSDLLADALRTDAQRVGPLASLILGRRPTWPGYLVELLAHLHRSGLIRHNPGLGWRWEFDAIRASGLPEDTHAVGRARLAHLTPSQRTTLGRAARLPSPFSAAELHAAVGGPTPDLARDLLDLTQTEILRWYGDDLAWTLPWLRPIAAELADPPGPGAAEVSRRVGLHMLRARERRLALAVSYLARGVSAAADPREVDETTQLAAVAAQSLNTAGCASAALPICEAARDALARAPNPSLQFRLGLETARAAFRNGDRDRARAELLALRGPSPGPTERALVTSRLVAVHALAGDPAEALRLALEDLRALSYPTGKGLGPLYDLWRTRLRLDGFDPQHLDRLPPASPRHRAIAHLLGAVLPVAWVQDRELATRLVLRAARLLLPVGRTDLTPVLALAWALVLVHAVGRPTDAARWAHYALELAARVPLHGTKVRLAAYALMQPTERPMCSVVDGLKSVAAEALIEDDAEVVGYGLAGAASYSLLGGASLREVDQRAEIAATVPQFDGARRAGATLQSMVAAVRDGRPLSAAMLEPLKRDGPMQCKLGALHLAWLVATLGETSRIREILSPHLRHASELAGLPHEGAARLLLGLSAVYRGDPVVATAYLRAMERSPWPEDAARKPLLDAELSSWTGNPTRAFAAYAEAVHRAREGGWMDLLAHASYRWSEALRRADLNHEARERALAASVAYRRWGARSRAQELEGAGSDARLETPRRDSTDPAKQALLESLERLQQNLDAEVEQRTSEARQAQLQAEAETAAHASLMASLSHETRTPLMNVVGHVQLLRDGALTAEQKHLLRGIERSIGSLTHLVEDLADLSRIEAGSLDLDLAPFDVRAALEEVTEMLAPLAHHKGLELYLIVDRSVPAKVIGDEGRYRQVALNLGQNAIKFTPRGHVSVNLHATAHAPGQCALRLEVVDTGIGIRKTQLPAVFEAFSQLDPRRYDGAGLGLAISARLCRAMGGELGARSLPGEGSAFWFQASFAVPPADTVEGIALPDERVVLVVDAEPLGGVCIQEKLSELGTRSDLARDLPELVARLLQAETHYDLVLLSWPPFDEAAVPEVVRSRLPLAVTCRLPDRAAVHERFGALTQLILPRPVRTAHLAAALRGMLVETPPPAPSRLRAVPAKAPRVLVVEDNPVNQRLTAALLERHGYATGVARTGAEALAMAQASTWDLVLMDCNLPGMDGFETTRELRAMERTRGGRLPVIALTASAMAGDRDRCLTAGMDAYLAKPVRAADLYSALERFVGPGRHP